MDCLQGRILVASPHLRDPNFYQTAVLVVRHGDDGTLGVVLNRPTEILASEVWKKATNKPCCHHGTLFHGGPCEGPLMVIHRCEAAGQIKVIPGVYFSTEQSDVEWLLGQDSNDSRFFIGSAGWAAGQLEQELQTGSWIVIHATVDHIFCDTGRWEAVLEKVARMGEIDPSVN
jgi:putative transcriptional regulator